MFINASRENALMFEQSKIHVRPDRSFETRKRNRIFGELLNRPEARLDTRNGRFKIGTSPPKGKVFIIDGMSDDICVVFTVD
eukprot:7807508-Heterocapsa_arctica.AAC.1